ncbi:MAG: hypothetical protein ACYTEX_27490 [Planctomycetota bacterium]|jgi:hypothetical protein
MSRRFIAIGALAVIASGTYGSDVRQVVVRVHSGFKSNNLRRIVHAAPVGKKISLITQESPIDMGLVACFTFHLNGELDEVGTYRIKPTQEHFSVINVYGFRAGEELMLGAVDPVWQANRFFLGRVRDGLSLEQPRVVLQEKGDSLAKWWLLTVSGGQKLFFLKSRFVDPEPLDGSAEREKGWLHCYNVDKMHQAMLEGVTRLEDATTGSYWVECAGAAGGEPYIWQTTYKQPDYLGRRTLRVARWSSGKLEWTSYQTGPQIHFAVDHSDGSTALILEFVKKKLLEPALPRSDLFLVGASDPTVKKVGSLEGDGCLRLQLLRIEDSKYPWAGLLLSSTAERLLLIRATESHEAVSTELPRPFEVVDAYLVSKGEQLYLFRAE